MKPHTEPRMKPRPAPIQIDRRQLNNGDGANERLDGFFNHSQLGNIKIQDTSKMADLGAGSGGYVTKVRHLSSGQVMARKVIRLEVKPDVKDGILKELEVLQKCNSPFIVSYYGSDYRNGEINIFMEYMDGRSLDYLLKKSHRIQEPILGKITTSVIKALTYLKDKHNIIHRDIKPSNILVNSHGQIKLCDLGVSGQVVNSIAQTFVGTRNYMSPERLNGKEYGVKSDIWGLGLTLVELALGRYPIPQDDPLKMYRGEESPEGLRMPLFALMDYMRTEPPPTIPGPPIFSSEFKDFVDRCLKKLEEDRFDLSTISHHEFVTRSERTHVDVALWVCQLFLPAPADHQQQQ